MRYGMVEGQGEQQPRLFVAPHVRRLPMLPSVCLAATVLLKVLVLAALAQGAVVGSSVRILREAMYMWCE